MAGGGRPAYTHAELALAVAILGLLVQLGLVLWPLLKHPLDINHKFGGGRRRCGSGFARRSRICLGILIVVARSGRRAGLVKRGIDVSNMCTYLQSWLEDAGDVAVDV